MDTISIIGGTGDEGSGLALRFAKAGFSVIIGSRNKSKAIGTVKKIKEKIKDANVRGMTNEEAVKEGNIILLVVPFVDQIPTLKKLQKCFKNGDILVDVCNPIQSNVLGEISHPVIPWYGSAAEQAKYYAPDYVSVVSAFKNARATLLQDLSKDFDSDIFVCSDDESAKKKIIELIGKITKARAVNLGPLKNSRLVEELVALMLYLEVKHNTDKHWELKLKGI